jgi:hypothetical protein
VAAGPHYSTYLLTALRYSDDLTFSLLEGVQTMHESTTYRRIINNGRLEEARRFLLRQGTKRFGEPDATTVTAVEAIQDVELLEALGEQMLDPGLRDWKDLLRGS